MTRPRSDWAVSMDALADRCFQLDANREIRRFQKQRLKEQQLLARTPGNDTSGCLLSSLIALVLLFVLAAIGVEFLVGFVLSIFLAVSIRSIRVRWMGSAPGRPGATAEAIVQRWKIWASVKQGITAYKRASRGP